MRRMLYITLLCALAAASPAAGAPTLDKRKAEAAVRGFLELFLSDRTPAAVKRHVDIDKSLARAFGPELATYPAAARKEAVRLCRLGIERIVKETRPFWVQHGIQVKTVVSATPSAGEARVVATVRRDDGVVAEVPFVVVAPGKIICVGAGRDGLLPDLHEMHRMEAMFAPYGKTTALRVLLGLASGALGAPLGLSPAMLEVAESAQTEWESADALTLPVRVAALDGVAPDERAPAGTPRAVVHLARGRTLWIRSDGGRGQYQQVMPHWFDDLKKRVGEHLASHHRGSNDKDDSTRSLSVLIRADRDAWWAATAAVLALAEEKRLRISSVALGVERAGAPPASRWGLLALHPRARVDTPRLEALLRSISDPMSETQQYQLEIAGRRYPLPASKLDQRLLPDATWAQIDRVLSKVRADVERSKTKTATDRRGARLRMRDVRTARVGCVARILAMLEVLGGGGIQLIEETD